MISRFVICSLTRALCKDGWMVRVNRERKGKKNNAEEWKGFSSLVTSAYYHRWRHPSSSKINVTILSKIGRSTNRETTYPIWEFWPFLEIIPVHNASTGTSNTNFEEKKRKTRMGRIRGLFWKFVSLLSMVRWDNTLFPGNT